MKARFLLLLALFCFCASALAETITGRVVGVHDGDSITLLTADRKELKVRLLEIDAPALGQPYGTAAKQELSRLVFNRRVSIKTADTDRYRRTLARVFLDGGDINLAMVEAGAAWAFREYMKDPAFLHAEKAAKAARRGLWKLQADQITAPWEWRKNKRSKQSVR